MPALDTDTRHVDIRSKCSSYIAQYIRLPPSFISPYCPGFDRLCTRWSRNVWSNLLIVLIIKGWRYNKTESLSACAAHAGSHRTRRSGETGAHYSIDGVLRTESITTLRSNRCTYWNREIANHNTHTCYVFRWVLFSFVSVLFCGKITCLYALWAASARNINHYSRAHIGVPSCNSRQSMMFNRLKDQRIT